MNKIGRQIKFRIIMSFKKSRDWEIRNNKNTNAQIFRCVNQRFAYQHPGCSLHLDPCLTRKTNKELIKFSSWLEDRPKYVMDLSFGQKKTQPKEGRRRDKRGEGGGREGRGISDVCRLYLEFMKQIIYCVNMDIAKY